MNVQHKQDASLRKAAAKAGIPVDEYQQATESTDSKNEEKEIRAALYARYSTDKQSEQSIPDQYRLRERLSERNGFTIVDRFQDAAISGGTAHRPGYQKLLAAARRRDFDVNHRGGHLAPLAQPG